jgi:integrase/recombinase XerD
VAIVAVSWLDCTLVQSTHMADPTTPLRQRMIDDMTIRNMAPGTRAVYVRAVKNFALHFKCSPDKLCYGDVRQYHLHLAARKLQPQTINRIMCALRFFYGTTLGMSGAAAHIPLARRSDPLPAILSREEVARFLKAIPNLKHRTAFAAIYAGLRVSEVVALTPRDIDSANMVIHVRQGKSRKDRYVMLSDQLLDLLREYWKKERPPHRLFPGGKPSEPITTRQLRRVFRAAADLLGHRHLNATARYARVALNTIRRIQSPLDSLKIEMAPPG